MEQVGVKAPIMMGLLVGCLFEKNRLGWVQTRNREQDDLLIGPFFRSVVVNRDTACGDVALFFAPGDVPGCSLDIRKVTHLMDNALEDNVGREGIAGFESHG